MTRKKRALAILLFFILSGGAAVYLSLLVQSRRFTILNHPFRLEPLSFSLLWSAAFFFMVILWTLLARAEARLTGLETGERLKKGFFAFLPFLFFFLSPLLLSHYFTAEDFRKRLFILGGLVLTAFLALTLTRLRREPGQKPRLIERFTVRFGGLSSKKKIAVLFFAALLIYNLAVFALVAQGLTFSGDEPNYLMSTDSLFYDKDINLANNYAEQDYFHFYSRQDHPRLKLGVYGRYGKKGPDSIYPINLPGISFLILPFYGLSRLFSGDWLTFILKGSLSVWAALLGVQIYLLAAGKWKNERLSLTLWAVYSFASPVFFYAIHLYPEVVVAFIGLLIYRNVISDKPLRPVHYACFGFLLSTLFWFGVKYNLIFWPLLLVSAWHLRMRREGRLKELAAFLAFPLVSIVLFFLYIHSLYGTFSPFSIYEGVMTAEQYREWRQMILTIPFRERLDAFLDYFLDQRDGLLFYSPFYVFALLGLVEMFKRAKREFFFVLCAALPFLLNYGFFTHRQGYSPQARVVMPVSWTAAIAVGYFLAFNKKPFFAATFRLLAIAGLAVTILLLFHPSFLYQPTTHEFTVRPGDLFVFLGNMHIFLPPFFPSFIKVDNTRYAPNFIWIAILISFVLSYLWLKRKEPAKPAVSLLVLFALLGTGFFLWVLYPRDSLYPVRTVPFSETRAIGLHTFPLGKGVVIKPSGDLFLHIEKSYRLLFSSRRKLNEVKISYGSEKGEYGVRAGFFDLPLFEDRTIGQRKEFVFSPLACYRVNGLYLYEINLDLKKYSPENMLVEPYFFAVTPMK